MGGPAGRIDPVEGPEGSRQPAGPG